MVRGLYRCISFGRTHVAAHMLYFSKKLNKQMEQISNTKAEREAEGLRGLACGREHAHLLGGSQTWAAPIHGQPGAGA